MNNDSQISSVFSEGDVVLLIDRRDKRYVINLRASDTFHSHMGTISHDSIIGEQEGSWLYTSRGLRVLALKPTMAEYIQDIPRQTQIVYPKDLGAILLLGDIFPGATVVEAGLGSGALTIALLRAVGPTGQVNAYEIREALVEKALTNIKTYMQSITNLTVKKRDIYKGIEEKQVDRIVLDLPEPWETVAHVADSLRLGGVLLTFLPTILQVHRLGETLQADARFQLVNTEEVLMRPWHVSPNSVRPEHRMIGHTGFITTARRCNPVKKPVSS